LIDDSVFRRFRLDINALLRDEVNQAFAAFETGRVTVIMSSNPDVVSGQSSIMPDTGGLSCLAIVMAVVVAIVGVNAQERVKGGISDEMK
jgi:hypothetical protein